MRKKPLNGLCLALQADHLCYQIEFPSILLPSDISSGSIVDITVSRNHGAEESATQAFADLQDEIYSTFGLQTPAPPILRCLNATQTSVVLEWDPIQLATAELRSLSLYRNGSKAGSIPRPLEMRSTKISGLALDTEYTFHLVLRTSAGTFSSEKLKVRTHKMTELSGIVVTPGIMPAQLKTSLAESLHRIGGKMIDNVRIETTHFVCTEARGVGWEKAIEMSIPVVVPDWIKGCEREGRYVPVRGYYLDADPRLRQVGPGVAIQQQQAQQQHPSIQTQPMNSPKLEVTPATPQATTRSESMRESKPENGTENDSDDDDDDLPSPPPKDGHEMKTSSGEEPKARLEDVKKESSHAPEIDDDGEDEEDEDEEPEENHYKQVEAGPSSQRREKDLDERFDEVTL